MSQDRHGDWIQTFSGRRVWPLDPRPDEIGFVDISYGLSKICRYGGHCLRFFSVAEHCALMAREAERLGASPQVRLQVLMHDSAEAYLGDIPRPIKVHLVGYAEAEDRMLECIAKKYGFDYPFDPMVKQLDEAILLREIECNLAKPEAPWHLGPFGVEPLTIDLQYWEPNEAAWQFTQEYLAIENQSLPPENHCEKDCTCSTDLHRLCVAGAGDRPDIADAGVESQ